MNKVKLKSGKKNERDYEYQIYIDDKLVWQGLNPQGIYDRMMKENPNKKISIAWKLKEGILIACI